MATWFDLSLVNGQTLLARFNDIATSLGLKAPIASPTFTGTVTAPTLNVTGTATAGAFSGPLTGTVTGSLVGNASTATTLQTARNINGVSFNGSAAISVNTNNALTNGAYLTGSAFNGGAAVTFAVDATSANTVSKVVARDGSGNFSAGTITAALTGNASTATTLQNARNINGVSFNGSANITVTANTTNTLTRGTYLTGTDFNGSAATTWAVDATNLNTASKIVARDASGNFAAGTITASLTGTASSATTLGAGADRTKLDGIAAGSTVNSTDAALRDRTTHTGTQAISTVTNLQTTLDAKAPLASPTFTGTVTAPAVTATGTMTATKYVTTAGATLTIAAGVVTATNSYHALDTEAAAATDDLDTINGGSAGMMLILRSTSLLRDIVCKDGTGNLRLAGDFTLSHTDDRLVLLHDGAAWMELSRSDNNL